MSIKKWITDFDRVLRQRDEEHQWRPTDRPLTSRQDLATRKGRETLTWPDHWLRRAEGRR